MFAHKYVRLVTEHGALYDDRVVWIKLEGVEGVTLELRVYTHPIY